MNLVVLLGSINVRIWRGNEYEVKIEEVAGRQGRNTLFVAHPGFHQSFKTQEARAKR